MHGDTGCRVFKEGTKLERFLPKNQHIPKGNDWILRIGVVASC